MPLSGDFDALSTLVRKFEVAGDTETLGQLSHALADEALQLIQAGFANQADPYGKAWAPLKRREGMILSDTGRLRGSVTVNSSPGEIRLRGTASYGTFHQNGTRYMPKRQILPNDGDLPGSWRAAFNEATEALFRHLFS